MWSSRTKRSICRRRKVTKSYQCIVIQVIWWNRKINCSCWGEKANVKLTEHQIIATKEARITNHGGCSLTALSYIKEKPRYQKVAELITWKQTQNAALNVTNSESMKVFRDYSKARTVRISYLFMLKDTQHFTLTLPTETLFKLSEIRFRKLKITCFFKNNLHDLRQ